MQQGVVTSPPRDSDACDFCAKQFVLRTFVVSHVKCLILHTERTQVLDTDDTFSTA